MNKKELLENYANSLPDGPNRAHYVRYASRFLDYATIIDKETVNRYVRRLKKEGKRPGTINFVFRVIRRLFVVNFGEKDWPYKQGEAPQVSQRDEYRPALDHPIIARMIEVALAGGLRTDEGAMLALSTTYGLRRVEMCELAVKDINLKDGTLFVSTVKGGRQRYHLIPEEIKPVLEAHDFEQRYSQGYMSQMFWGIINKCELDVLKTETLGWHSVRRPLLTSLIETGLDPFAAKAFLRWKGGAGDLAMPERYYSNTVIGLQGSKVVTQEGKKDAEIFEKYHPYVGLWRAS